MRTARTEQEREAEARRVAALPLYERLALCTERQRAIYGYIRDFIKAHGYAPTVRDIGREFGIRCPNGVLSNLRALERKGLIRRGEQKARGIALVDSPLAVLLDAAKGIEPVLRRNLYPCPDKPDSDWAKAARLFEAIDLAEGRMPP